MRHSFLLSASIIAAIAPGVASAQVDRGSVAVSGAGSESGTLPDIVVTATRQATNVQSTPLAITAVTSENLVQRGLTNAADLAGIIPNASFRRSQGIYGPGVSAFIRGIGQLDTSLAQEPGVAFYVDDVYYPLLFGSLFDLLDLDHVEVLRGPQGTLFGRNALAGAINLVSRQPSLSEARGYVEATAGNFARRDFRGGFNLPITGTLAINLAALSKERLGYQKRLDFRCEMVRRGTPELAGTFPFSDANLINGSNRSTPDDCTIGRLGGENVRAGRGQLLWRPGPDVSLTISADYVRDNSDAPADSLLSINPATANTNANLRSLFNRYTAPGGPTFFYDSRFLTGNPYTTYATFADPVPAGTAIPGNSFYNGSNFRGGIRNAPISRLRNWGVSGKLVYGVAEDIDLTLVGGYRSITATYPFDVDGTPLALENNRNDVAQQNFSGEFRVSGKRSWIDWVVGLFYYEADGTQRFAGTSPYNNTLRYQTNDYTPRSKAAYANVVIRPFDKLGITLGGRYSDDKKPVNFYSVIDGTTAASTVYAPATTGSTIFDINLAKKRFDWKLGLDYHLADRTMVYASAATGFRLPGFNARPFQATQVGQFPGEEILSYELGVKTDLFDRRLRLNATAFYTDYKTRIQTIAGAEYLLDPAGRPVAGNQVTVPAGQEGVTICQAAPAGTQGFQCISRTFYVNIPGKVKGIEAEIEASPVERLTLSASIGYTHFTAPDLKARPATANRRLLQIPDWTASAGIQYEIAASALGGTITPRLDWLYTDDLVYSVTRTQTNQPSYSVFNGRITYRNDDHGATVALSVTNLFNKFYYRNIFVYEDIGFPQVNGQPAPPREWSLTLAKRF
ncbi:MAG: TonB-dependent receptor [Sphingomonas fennica]